MNHLQAPPVPVAIVEYLEKQFPDKAGERNDSPEELRWKAAQVSVVRHLRSLLTAQTKNYQI